MDPRILIRIHTKISWICNTVENCTELYGTFWNKGKTSVYQSLEGDQARPARSAVEHSTWRSRLQSPAGIKKQPPGQPYSPAQIAM
jgi:hypothetical protein